MVTFETFFYHYISYVMKKHSDNEYWKTVAQTVENLGGIHQVKFTYQLWCEVPEKAQKDICGCTVSELKGLYQ